MLFAPTIITMSSPRDSNSDSALREAEEMVCKLKEEKAREKARRAAEAEKKKREAEGVPRHRQQCADISLVLKQLHKVGRLTCFEWVWASNDHGSWKISGAWVQPLRCKEANRTQMHFCY